MIVFLYIGTSLCVYFVYCLNLVKKIVIIIIVIIKNSKCVIVFLYIGHDGFSDGSESLDS